MCGFLVAFSYVCVPCMLLLCVGFLRSSAMCVFLVGFCYVGVPIMQGATAFYCFDIIFD